MNKLLRLIVISLSTFFLLVVGAAFLLSGNGEPQSFKERVISTYYFIKDPPLKIVHERRAEKIKSARGNHAEMGKALMKQEKYLEARSKFSDSLKIDRGLYEKYGPYMISILTEDLKFMAECEKFLGNSEEALNYLKEAIGVNEDHNFMSSIPYLRLEIAEVYSHSGDYDKAQSSFRMVLEEVGDKALPLQKMASLKMAEISRIKKEYGKAEQSLQRALEITRVLRIPGQLSEILGKIAEVSFLAGEYKKSLEYYQQLLESLNGKSSRKKQYSKTLKHIGITYDHLGNYEQSLHFFQKALAIDQHAGDMEGVARSYNFLGRASQELALYDEALEYFKKAIEFEEKLGNRYLVAANIMAEGELLQKWGRPDLAIKSYEQALSINQELEKHSINARLLYKIGTAYAQNGDHQKALVYYQRAQEQPGRERLFDDTSIFISGQAASYLYMGDYNKALDLFKKGWEISRQLNRGEVAELGYHIDLGTCYFAMKELELSEEHYRKAMALARRFQRDSDLAVTLTNLGGVLAAGKKFDQAIKLISESLELKEKIRSTAKGKLKRDYLASQLDTYQLLASIYCSMEDFDNLFKVIEKSKARFMAERIDDSGSLSELSLQEARAQLADNEAMVMYVNIDENYGIVLVITKDSVVTKTLDKIAFLNTTQNLLTGDVLDQAKKMKIGEVFVAAENGNDSRSLLKRNHENFRDVINLYRDLLQRGWGQSDRAIRKRKKNNYHTEIRGQLASALYDFLIEPVADAISDKEELIFIPDGILNFLPFETLGHSRYLMEDFTVSYVPSVRIHHLIKQREYGKRRRAALAFGGAIYSRKDKLDYSLSPFTFFGDNTRSTIEKNRLEQSFSELMSVADLTNLPATLDEVLEMGNIMGTDIMVGEEASEENVKAMSERGELADYTILHFATHGLLVPAMPELSSVVMTLPEKSGQEDGFLTAGEVHKLKLQADFVNLSACETGLGKLYGGEGVVGLTQAFILAGANGLSSSLWKVADESTSLFMKEMYLQTIREKIGYSEAMNRAKRKFARGDFGEEYRNPFYWAPFIYIGK